MHKIISVDFLEYYSDSISEELLESYLVGSTCNCTGTLKLKLGPGRNLVQEGPYLLPPIRWLESFEYYAEFYIICEVK